MFVVEVDVKVYTPYPEEKSVWKRTFGYIGLILAVIGVFVIGAEPNPDTEWWLPIAIGAFLLILGGTVAWLCLRPSDH